MTDLWWMNNLASPEGRQFLALYMQTVLELASGKVYAYALVVGGSPQRPSISLKPVYDFDSIATKYYPQSVFWVNEAPVLVCVADADHVADEHWLADIRSWLAADLPQRRPALSYATEQALHSVAAQPAATQQLASTVCADVPSTYYLN